MGQNRQVSRILKMIHYLEMNPNGLRARDILVKLEEDGFSCDRTTVYRGLSAIQAVNIPLIQEGAGQDSVWRLFEVTKVSNGVSFDYKELLALFIASLNFHAT